MTPRTLLAVVAALVAGACTAPSIDPGDGGQPPVPRGPEPVAGSWWRPTAGMTWQWQLDGTIDTSVDAQVYDVDLFDTPASTVAALQARGVKVICYFTVGSWETYREDVASVPEAVKGKPVDGWPEERWLDIRRLDVLAPYFEARMDLCRDKGFDGVEGDWMDNHTQDTGFPISSADQLAFSRWLVAEAHERGLAMGVKNALDHAEELADEADFSVNEQCFQYDECDRLLPWIAAGKPVFHTEYERTVTQFCPSTQPMGFSSIEKRLSLRAWRRTC